MLRPSRLRTTLPLCCWVMFIWCAARIGAYAAGAEHTPEGFLRHLRLLTLLVVWGVLLVRL